MFFFSIMHHYQNFKWRLLFNKLKKIKLLILDIDGVLTDGSILIDSSGEVLKKFDVKDGMGIKLLQEIGIEIIFLSGGVSGAAQKRAEQLGVKSCFTGIKDKYIKIQHIQEKRSVTIDETAYVGDDINDIVVRPIVSLLFAPSNASSFILKKADIVLLSSGGSGAIREIAEKFLCSRGLLKKFSENGWKGKNY